MQILLYSYFPLRKNHTPGGAQQVVYNLTLELASKHRITVICPHISDENTLLTHDNLTQCPILRENLPGAPLNFEVQVANRAKIAEAVEKVDLIWSVDRFFPLQSKKPILLSLQTIAYQLEMDSFFSLNWDKLIVPSLFLYDKTHTACKNIEQVAFSNMISIIPNPINFNHFKPTNPVSLKQRLGLSEDSKYLVFPHRPDPGKGIDTAFALMKKLKERNLNYKLLVPGQPASIREVRDKEKAYIESLKQIARIEGLQDYIIFHEWIAQENLPEYYSLGVYSLHLSTLPEGFGLTGIESVSCGTPAITTNYGALKEHLPPDKGMNYIDLNNLDNIVEVILKEPNTIECEQGRKILQQKYDLSLVAKQYEKCMFKLLEA